MPPKNTKTLFEWKVNEDRFVALSKNSEKIYKSCMNALAKHTEITTVEGLLEHDDIAILYIQSLPTHAKRVQTFLAVMYLLGIGKKKDGTLAKLTPKTLPYYNAYQKTKIDKEGKEYIDASGNLTQRIFNNYKDYLKAFTAV